MGRKPHPTSMDMVHRVTPWTSSVWLESSHSHYDFKSTFLLIGRAGSVVLAGNMWRRSFCHHIRRSPHRNVFHRDDSRIASRQQVDWSNCVSHSGISWHCRIVWNIIHSIRFRCAHQITAYPVSILLKHFFEDCDGSMSPNMGEGVRSCVRSPHFLFWFFAVKLLSLVLLCIRYIPQGNLSCALMHSQNSQLGASTWTISTMLGGHQCMCVYGRSWWMSSLGITGVRKWQFHCSEDNQSLLSSGYRPGTWAK